MIPDTRQTPTPRETQILQLIAGGSTNKQISAELGMSEATVKNHMLNILERLGLLNRTHAVVTAIKKGWIEV